MKTEILSFHCNNFYANNLQFYIIPSLPVLLGFYPVETPRPLNSQLSYVGHILFKCGMNLPYFVTLNYNAVNK